MNADPVKKIGKIKEQINTEHKARRNFPRKWSKFCNGTPWDEMYNQNTISKQLKSQLKDLCPYQYNNEGDSYFVSRDMYKSLIEKCRCGRPHADLHLVRCLQSPENKYLLKEVVANQEEQLNDEEKIMKKVPETSTGFLGWQSKQPKYKQWENSMKYISPVYDMPGEKITSTPYNTIIIG